MAECVLTLEWTEKRKETHENTVKKATFVGRADYKGDDRVEEMEREKAGGLGKPGINRDERARECL